MKETIKERLITLVKKLISLKIILGITVLIVLLTNHFIDGVTFVVGFLLILGVREISKNTQVMINNK